MYENNVVNPYRNITSAKALANEMERAKADRFREEAHLQEIINNAVADAIGNSQKQCTLSTEALEVLQEIIEHENETTYWDHRFEGLSKREDTILRGCFKELKDNDMVNTMWSGNKPYYITVLKNGYQYIDRQHKLNPLSSFELEMAELLKQARQIKPPINAASIGTDMAAYNKPSNIWINDFEIFYNKYLMTHPFARRIETILFYRNLSAFNELVEILESIKKDKSFIGSAKSTNSINIPSFPLPNHQKKFDVFLSHANKDKLNFVDDLYSSLNKLGISIFYDKDSLEWGDYWKQQILEGTQKAEFAIIIISDNFFGRDWTERELYEFLNRQNKSGQKIILPILHNISIEDLRTRYPSIAEIQALSSKQLSCDHIALLFARQLISKLKNK